MGDTSATALIGVIGGLGPAATIHYYSGLLTACERKAVTPRLIINQADIRLVLDAAGRGDREALVRHLSERATELQRAGADLLAIAAVTPHLCVPELSRRIACPLIDMVVAVDRELRRKGIERVALMGTRSVVESRMFGRLTASVVDPAQSQMSAVHDLYVSIVRSGRVDPHASEALRSMALEYLDQLGVQTIVLAGTELALAPPETWRGIDVMDCAALHIDEIVAAACQRASN